MQKDLRNIRKPLLARNERLVQKKPYIENNFFPDTEDDGFNKKFFTKLKFEKRNHR